MSWGNRILMVFIAFAGLMSYMVYRCVQTPVELVAREYYRDELAYQDVIDGTKKANALSRNISVSAEAGKITVQFPPEMENNLVTGNILFYNAADESKDRKFIIKDIRGSRFQVEKTAVKAGYYTVKINWASAGIQYYTEQAFNVLP